MMTQLQPLAEVRVIKFLLRFTNFCIYLQHLFTCPYDRGDGGGYTNATINRDRN